MSVIDWNAPIRDKVQGSPLRVLSVRGDVVALCLAKFAGTKDEGLTTFFRSTDNKRVDGLSLGSAVIVENTPTAELIKTMTEWEVLNRWQTPHESVCDHGVRMRVLHDLGLIREETRAQRFARETGHILTPAVEAALNYDA